MKKTTITILLTLSVWLANAQFVIPTPYVVANKDWIRYSSQRSNVANGPTAIDANQNVYSTGYTGNSSATYNILTQKRDSLGNIIFNVQYNNGGFDRGNAIKIHGVFTYVAGVSYSSSGNNDGILLCYNATGTLVWQHRFDNVGQDDEFVDVKTDASQNAYVTGKAMNSTGNYDIVTRKINPSGGLVWTHTFAGSANMDDKPIGLVIIGNNVYIAGNTTDAVNGTDWIVYQIDKNSGTGGWTKQINGASNTNDLLNAVIISGADIVVCGEIDNTGNLDACTIRLDGNTGNPLYQKNYDFGGVNNRATSIVRDSTGNIASVGVALNGSIYQYHTQIFDSLGNQLNINIESTGLTSLSVDPRIACDTIASHFYVCGEALRTTKDMFAYQITPSGNTTWREYVDGQNSDIDAATGLAVNGIGVVYLCGLTRNSTGIYYDFTNVKISQTPVYFPPDFNNQPANWNHLYLPNKGQLIRTDSTLANEVLYYTHNTTPELFIEKTTMDFVFRHNDPTQTALDTSDKIQLKFMNSNQLAEAHEYLPKSTVYNYFLGYAASPEITDLQGNERVFIPNIYASTDLHYFSCPGGLKYYMVLKPYATNEIQIKVDGAESVAIDGTTGNLKVNGAFGKFELERPVFYTVNMLGQVVPISGTASWNNVGGTTYAIGLPSYNNTMPTIIQVSQAAAAAPAYTTIANLDYSTYKGSAGTDVFNDVAASTNGDRQVTGWTDSQFFPVFNNLFPYISDHDIVILKYTADDTLRVASFMGDIAKDEGNSIAVNSTGDIFIGGITQSKNFPIKTLTGASNQTVNTSGSFNPTDGILAKFTPTTTAGGKPTISHNWSRYFGGSLDDGINSIHVDGSGNLYIVGEAHSPTLALTNAAQAINSNSTNGSSDAFLAKFNSSLAMVFGTFFGGGSSIFTNNSRDIGNDILVDWSGRIMICGRTDASNLPVINSTGNSTAFYQGALKGQWDGFLARFSPTGTKQYASYFGGNGLDELNKLAYDPISNQMYFAGASYDSTAFPFYSKTNAMNSRIPAYRTAFVGQMGNDYAKQWCSFYGKGHGSSKTFSVTGLDVDGYGVLYLSGSVSSDSLIYPTTPPTTVVYKDSVIQGKDGFVAIFNPDQSLYHSHYFGGSADDLINGATISQGQKLYLVGVTQSTNFPIAYPSPSTALITGTNAGGSDGFISRFDLNHYQVTGLKHIAFDKTELTVYPNPSNSDFYLELAGQLKSKPLVRVYNLMGQIIYQQTITDNKTQINCESWANGVYLISVNNNEAQSTFKLIKN